MKVLLIATNTLKEPYPVYPLGLDYVAEDFLRRGILKGNDSAVLEEMSA